MFPIHWGKMRDYGIILFPSLRPEPQSPSLLPSCHILLMGQALWHGNILSVPETRQRLISPEMMSGEQTVKGDFCIGGGST
jgi:hypothetical protein